MPRLLTDQNFNRRIVEAVLDAAPELTSVSVRAFGMDRAPDPDLLAFAQREDYVFLTHDAKTVPNFVHAMIRDGVTPPRVVIIPERMSIGPAVEELVLLLLAGNEGDWQRNPVRLPL